MATLQQIKVISTCIALMALSAQATAECQFIESYIEINNWTQPPPKNVYVEIAPQNTDSGPKKKIRYKAVITEPVPAYGLGRGLALIQDETPLHRFKTSDSYVVFIDNNPTYKISNIKSTNQIQLACPIQSFHVNDCNGSRGPNLAFDASCR